MDRSRSLARRRAACLYGPHQLGLALERRGWLYYTLSSRKGCVSLAIAAAIDPVARKVQELQEQEVEQDAEPGDPPEPDSGKPRS